MLIQLFICKGSVQLGELVSILAELSHSPDHTGEFYTKLVWMNLSELAHYSVSYRLPKLRRAGLSASLNKSQI